MAKFIIVCGEKGASVIMLTFRDVTASRQSKRACSALDFRNVGVALVGQHHVGRGIKGRLVQRRTGVHVLGIDIHRTVVAHQLQTALTSSTLHHLGIAQASLALLSTCATHATVVVGIVAVMFVVHGSVHTAVLGPEEETSGLEHFSRLGHTYLSEVACFIPAHVVKHSVLVVKHTLHSVGLVLVAIAVTGFLVALLIVFNFIQRYSPPLTGVIAGENKGAKPHGFSAVYPFGFMCWTVH